MAFIVKKLPKKLTDGLLAYWKLDNNNWLDSSNNGNTLTNNGNVTVGTGKINGDAVFNESNSLTNSSLAIPNSAFSISTWVKSSTYIDGSVIAGQWSYLDNPPFQVAINCNFGYINALWSTDGTSLTDRWVTDIPLPYDDIWHHVVLTFDGTTERIYWDGVDSGSFVPNGLSYQTSGFGIGNGNNGYFDGEIDECGVWDRALTQSEIKQLYNSGSGITYPFYSSLLLHMDGANGSTNFTDSSINDLPITVNANPQISTAQSKFGGSSAYFDGDGSYLDVSNLPSNYLSQDFTIEAWVWIDGSKYNSCLFNTFPHNSFGVSLKREDADNLTTVFIGNGSNWSSSFSSDTLLSFDTWQHIALVRRNNTITLYENGIARGSINDVPSGFGTSLRIGSITYIYGLNGEEYKGYMDEFRIIKYAAYTSNFTPPTQPFEFSGARSLIIKKNTTFKIPRTPVNLFTCPFEVDTDTCPTVGGLSDPGWFLAGNTSRIGKTTAPDGSNTAVEYESLYAGGSFVSQGFLQYWLPNTTYVFSIWAKSTLGLATDGQIVNVTKNGGSDRVVIEALGNLTSTWQKFTITFTTGPSRNSYITAFFCGDITEGVRFALWGAEMYIIN